MRKLLLAAAFTLPAIYCFAQADITDRIIREEMQHSQVMDLAWHLTDVSGPRLTASPGYDNAANWAKNTLSQWDLKNANLEPWGEFGKGWEAQRCYVAITKPYYQSLISYPKAWTGSTPGNRILTSGIVLIKAKDSAELVQYAGKLKDKVVMFWVPDTLRPNFQPDASRYADSSLQKMANAVAEPRQQRQGPRIGQAFPQRFAFQRFQTSFMLHEKPALVLSNSRGTEGTVFVQSGGPYAKDAAQAPATVVLSSDDYLRLQRLVDAGIPVELEAEVRTKFFDKELKAYNVIAEIPGSDPKLKDEVVMLGGHLDSWHAGTGATDNAAGCAVMMEAVRLIKTMNLQPRRTIRIALWSGEEQGLLGSRGYVEKHFGNPATMQITPAQEKISAYYNLDNGSGKIRGVYLQGNDKVKPIFEEWLKPFAQYGASTLTINNTGSTDHVSFDGIGIPGFQFIQDPLEYGTRTHHSNMDTYDHLSADDLKEAAAVVASFVYNTAQRDEKLPRKPLPEPRGVNQ
ncbi:MAG: M28 family metallopeptidase [Candidatus Dadabacteria bacterium]